MSIEEMYPKGLHSARTVAAQWAGFDEIVLTHVLILKVSSHCNLPLKATITDGAVVWQGFCVGGKVLRQVILSEKSAKEKLRRLCDATKDIAKR